MTGQWHPDPEGRFEYRWWDGAAWTDRVSHQGQVHAVPLGEAAGCPTPVVPTPPQTSATAPPGPATGGFSRHHRRPGRRSVQREGCAIDRKPELQDASGPARRAVHGAPRRDDRLPGQCRVRVRGRRRLQVHQEDVHRRRPAADALPGPGRRVPRRPSVRCTPAAVGECRPVDQRQERACVLLVPGLEHRTGQGRQHRHRRLVQHHPARLGVGGTDHRRSAGGAQRRRGPHFRRHQRRGRLVGEPADPTEDQLQGGSVDRPGFR